MIVVMVVIATTVTSIICLTSYKEQVIQGSEDQTSVVASQGASRINAVMTDAENLIYDIIFYIQAHVEKDKLLSKDEEYISNFVNEFKEVEQQLSSAMDNMMKSVNEIISNSVTSAQATESIASSAKTVSEKTKRLFESVEQTKYGCDKLTDVMNRFTL